MFNVGGPELLVIFFVALVVLGPTRLPQVARQMGQTVSTLRSLASSFQAEVEAAAKPLRDAANAEMTLDGPTSQDAAIAATQKNRIVDTDPQEIARAAREVTHADDDADGQQSPGGPTALSAEPEPDPDERDGIA